MVMHLFYSNTIKDNLITLPEQESNHCAKVLRLKAGELVKVTDGMGNVYEGKIQISHEKNTVVEITHSIHNPPTSHRLHLYVGITKNADRLEWMLEKSVELGLQSFTPIITHRTEKKNIRTDRLKTIALSAMKQSLHSWMTVINEPLKFNDAISLPLNGSKLIGYCGDDITKTALKDIVPDSNAHVFIGPEGDFTMDEIQVALKNDFNCIHMGESRLRTETAGLLTASWMYLNNMKE